MSEQDALKQRAAKRAVDFVQSGAVVGLGSGSTLRFVLLEIGARLADGRLREIVGVPTSEATAALAGTLHIPLASLDERPALDLAIDGADEIDPQLNLIKGLGGALLREKVVASAAAQFVVVADSSKLVGRLGSRAPLPVEVIPFALAIVRRKLVALGANPRLRATTTGAPFVTDEGNVILDCATGPINDPAAFDVALRRIPGVVEHGLFLGMATQAVVAEAGGVRVVEKPN
ncbi:MAG: ribose-5-phosphate isomerase RpiA [Chloroflexales bacterium]|nr:ribose-5-phosphate isomerase RpiA [Chloroflexales bacterium]